MYIKLLNFKTIVFQIIYAVVQLTKYLTSESNCDFVWMSVNCYMARFTQQLGITASFWGMFVVVGERCTATLLFRTYENRFHRLGPALLAVQVCGTRLIMLLHDLLCFSFFKINARHPARIFSGFFPCAVWDKSWNNTDQADQLPIAWAVRTKHRFSKDFSYLLVLNCLQLHVLVLWYS